MVKREMPEDFQKEAPGLRVAEAQRRWNVSEATARRWFMQAGITPRRLRPSERSPSRRPRVRRAEEDTREMIRECLRCTAADCRGSCAKIQAMRAGL